MSRLASIGVVALVGMMALPSHAATPAAAACSSPLPAGAATTCTGVGPGTFISVDGGGGCTLAFVIRGSNRSNYVTTAGHCVVENGSGTRTWKQGKGPIVRLSTTQATISGSTTGSVIGRVVYAVQEKDSVADSDFALVRLENNVAAYSSVPYFGGPTGINTSRSAAAEILNLFGRPPAVGEAAPGRQLVARDLANGEHAFANGVSLPGDSGAPVLDAQGRAVGLLVGAGGNTLEAGTTALPSDNHGGGLIRIVRLAPALAKASRVLRVGLKLSLGS